MTALDPETSAAAQPCCSPDAGPAAVSGSHLALPRGRSRIVACSLLLLLVCCSMVVVARGVNRSRPVHRINVDRRAPGLLPGEFEPQEAILLAWPTELWSPRLGESNDWNRDESRLFVEMVRAICRSVPTAILVSDSRSQDRVARILRQGGVSLEVVSFVQVPFNCEWIRDYGPLAVRAGDGSCTLVDAEYLAEGLLSLDPQEDRLPFTLGALFNLRVVRAPIALQHGNLLSNGRGLCITTRRTLEYNFARGYDAEDVTLVLKKYYGAKRVVFLETLNGEPTGHVDMFATFTSPDTVVVGQCSAESDPVNAAILDRNAQRLACLAAPFGPLNVVRIPMPKLFALDGSKLWPTYTNVVYANDTLLVPVYPGLDPAAESTALARYEELLPGWTIVPIDAFPILSLGGSLHCIALNLASAGKIARPTVDHLPQLQTSMD